MFQVTHPPLTALDLNPTDPLLACTLDGARVAVKTAGPWKSLTSTGIS